jgi:hypothetical protein
MSDFPSNGAFVDAPELEKDPHANRVHIEFYCQGCFHYTYVWLSLNLNGNHLMNCPNCARKHYRVVRDGVITGDRHDDRMPELHEIIAMKSACVPQDKRRKMGSIARQREMEAMGEMK